MGTPLPEILLAVPCGTPGAGHPSHDTLNDAMNVLPVTLLSAVTPSKP